jgi:exodeoxyribonuclease VII small subunit
MAENTGARPARSFEAALEDLEKLVKELEAGDLPLERSLELFERGVTLAADCRQQLEAAETRVEILLRKDGQVSAETFPVEESEKRRRKPPTPRPFIAPCATACSPAASGSGRCFVWSRRTRWRTMWKAR